ncbi:MAG: hypothetical protein QOF06_1538 [Solirubrobacterales bacterium]|jgi:hypothetical protein|nr:hypothetical protein [Solirubrobacterales bacterium]
MNIKTVKGAAIAIVAFVALTSQALAATPEGDPAGGKFPVAATATSGVSTMTTPSRALSCSSGSGSGAATSKTTGEGNYLLKGCTSLGTNCTTPGQASGMVTITISTAHLVYLDENHTKPGVLGTPPASGVFSTFSCGFGLVHVEVKGNGLLGEITAPKCGETSKMATVVMQGSEGGGQKYQQVEETGTKYDTVAYINGTPETVGTDWTVTGTSVEAVTLTCPEQK